MTSKPDWTKAADLPPDELDRLLEEDHDEVDDNPPATDEQLAAMRPASQVLPPALYAALARMPGQRGPGKRAPKVQLTLRFDPDVIEAYRATGPGWQTRITDVVKMAAPKVA